jgi:chemotaxis protein methyltransferase CheR
VKLGEVAMENPVVGSSPLPGCPLDLIPFKNLIREKSGLSFKAEALNFLGDAVRECMAAHGDDVPAYLARLAADPEEVSRLINCLTVNETYFLREPHHFRLLTGHLMPNLLRKGAGRAVRILSAGCSFGAEPYSILIALVDRFGWEVLDAVTVTALDINPSTIALAQVGVYGRHAFRGVAEEIRNTYFHPAGDERWSVDERLRRHVEFHALNLLTDAVPGAAEGYDVIFYRNVSIYFEPETQKALFARLASVLREDGSMILGSVETSLHNKGVLYLTERDGIYFYSKQFSIRMDTPAEARGVRARAKIAADPAAKAEEALSLVKQEQFDAAWTILAEIPVADRSLAVLFLQAEVLVNLQRLAEAQAICLDVLQKEPWNLTGLLLLGTVVQLLGDRDESLHQFKKAAFVEPACWLAHYYLAEIHYAREEFDLSAREYALTLSLLEKNGIRNYGLEFFPLSFSAEQLMHLCRSNLERLKQESMRG